MALVGAGCGGSDDGSGGAASTDGGGSGATKLTIGMIDDLTGGVAQAGRSQVCGALLATDLINKEHLVPSVQIDLEVEDAQSETATAARLATSMTADGVNIFVGGSASADLLAQIPIFNDAGALYTSGLTLAPEVVSKGKLPLRLNPDGVQAGKYLAELLHELGAKSVVFVGDQGAYGEGAIAGAKQYIDPKIKTQTITVSPDVSSFGSTLSKVGAAHAEYTVFFIAGTVREVAFLRDYARAKLDAKAIAGPNVISDPVIQSAGGAGDGVLTGVYYAPFIDNPQNKKFLEAYDQYGPSHSECKGSPVSFLMENGYSQVMVVAQSAHEAGSDDPAKIRQAALSGSFDLPRGTVRFQPDGQIDAKFLATVGDGDKGLVGYDPATGTRESGGS